MAQDTCGPIGNNNETQVTPSRARSFYLNAANPAPCTGNITSWRVCYYGPNNVYLYNSFWATYAVYREMGTGDDVRYERVSRLFTTHRVRTLFQLADEEVTAGGFNCYNDTLDSISPLTIRSGDILGVCVFDPDSDDVLFGRQLDVVGEVSGQSVLQMGTSGCTTEAIPSNIPANQLSNLSSMRVHVYANIGKNRHLHDLCIVC